MGTPTIEWPNGPHSTDISVNIPDNWPTPATGPAEILVASMPWKVNVTFDVGSHGMLLGGSFQVRAYAESVGPGQEVMLGEQVVPVTPGKTTPYTTEISVAGGTLLGEGQPDPATGLEVSGVYKIVVVLQHLNPTPTFVSGFAEETLRMFLSP